MLGHANHTAPSRPPGNMRYSSRPYKARNASAPKYLHDGVGIDNLSTALKFCSTLPSK